ncbi:MAG TPA: 3-phosphoshikimate 1-carboxyvinyltransferase [Armatimonadota bacterium]|nr:3-phosphoshikimate 1-carboxyvinyltransferase [Armatimonadota bacterium]
MTVEPSSLSGVAEIPGSKSHTIRAVFFAALAEGTSHITAPLDSRDTRAAITTCRALGAEITPVEGFWIVQGTGGMIVPPARPIDVENSGTTLRVGLCAGALGTEWAILTGDEQIRRRPAGPLINSLNELGALAFSTRGDGAAPIAVRGPMEGGFTTIDCITSQYLSALLINCPLARKDTEIKVGILNEAPYVWLTLAWLDRLGIEYCHKNLRHFHIAGDQRYESFSRRIPADFSSATFPLVAAAVTGSTVTLRGLDMTDPQGDKAVIEMLIGMGCEVTHEGEGTTITGKPLTGIEIDMNYTPDALPALAVAGAFASGETRLVNVPQARVKEVDRIAVMHQELAKMGVECEELEDGLIIHGGDPKGAEFESYGDHRIAMAMAVAGLAADGTSTIEGAEAVDVTFPGFADVMASIGAQVSTV